MRKLVKFKKALADEEGVAAPIIGLFIVVFVIFLAFAVDLGRLYIVKNELQNAADAAALAGARELNQTAQTINSSIVSTAVQDCALQNKSIGLDQLHASAEIGKWDFGTQTFTPVPNPTFTTEVNAVRATVRRMGEDGASSENSKMVSAFAGMMGYSQLGTQATAVAYLGITGSAIPTIPFALPDTVLTAALSPEAQESFWGLLTPTPAYAVVSRTLTWKDLGGAPTPQSSSLDLTRGTWVDSDSSPDMTSVSQLVSGSKKFSAIKVGSKLYPMSEWQWGSNIKTLFSNLKTRYDANKDANGKWRVTVAVYDRNQPTALRPSKSPWSRLAFKAASLVSEAQACTAYNTPYVYTDGFAVIDITGVTVKSNCVTTSGTNSQGQYYQVVDPNSCRNTCSMTIEVPLDQNFRVTDATATGNNFERTFSSMNGSGNPVGVFNAAPKIVK
jgi:Flp pilus assembly protein TadG